MPRTVKSMALSIVENAASLAIDRGVPLASLVPEFFEEFKKDELEDEGDSAWSAIRSVRSILVALGYLKDELPVASPIEEILLVDAAKMGLETDEFLKGFGTFGVEALKNYLAKPKIGGPK